MCWLAASATKVPTTDTKLLAAFNIGVEKLPGARWRH